MTPTPVPSYRPLHLQGPQPLPYAVPYTTAIPPDVLARIDPTTSAGSDTCEPIKLKRVYTCDTSLLEPAQHAKELEWKNVLSAIQKAFYDWFETFDFGKDQMSIDQLINSVRKCPVLPPEQQFEERLRRFIISGCERAKQPCPADLSAKLSPCLQAIHTKSGSDIYDSLELAVKSIFSELAIPLDTLEVRDQFATDLSELAYQYEHSVQNQAVFARKNDKFWGYLTTCITLLQADVTDASISDAKPLALTALYKIRDALDSNIYKLYKTSDAHPGVQLLHNLCVALYATTEVMPGYQHFCRSIHKTNVFERRDALGCTLQKTWVVAAQHGIAKSDAKNKDSFWTRISKTCQVLIESAINPITIEQAIQNCWRSFTSYAAPFKDHHGFYDNNPGALWEETFSTTDQSVTHRMQTVVSASPACGSNIVPEFLALLQALENQHFDPLNAHPYQYTKVAYSNLQSKKGETEGLQTYALMKLNTQYPFSFSGITVSPEPRKETKLTKALVDKMYKELIAPESFKPAHTPGYYFSPQDKAEWSSALRLIIDKCFSYFGEQKSTTGVNAFSEFLSLAIIRYHEMRTMSSMQQPDTTMIGMRICQAGVDRAGKVNGGFLWSLDKDATTSQLDAIIFGRAVLAKGRLPLQDKLRQLQDVTRVLSREKLKQFFEEIDDAATGGTIKSNSIRITGV